MDIIFWNWQIISDRRIDEKESMNLLYVTVKALLNPNIDDRLVRCIFELRMMAAQGLCPSLFHCVCCERQPVEGEELFFLSRIMVFWIKPVWDM